MVVVVYGSYFRFFPFVYRAVWRCMHIGRYIFVLIFYVYITAGWHYNFIIEIIQRAGEGGCHFIAKPVDVNGVKTFKRIAIFKHITLSYIIHKQHCLQSAIINKIVKVGFLLNGFYITKVKPVDHLAIAHQLYGMEYKFLISGIKIYRYLRPVLHTRF